MKKNTQYIVIGSSLAVTTAIIFYLKNKNNKPPQPQLPAPQPIPGIGATDTVSNPDTDNYTPPYTPPINPTPLSVGDKVYAVMDGVYIAKVKTSDDFWYQLDQNNIVKRFNKGEYMGKIKAIQGNATTGQIVKVNYTDWWNAYGDYLTHSSFITTTP